MNKQENHVNYLVLALDSNLTNLRLMNLFQEPDLNILSSLYLHVCFHMDV